MFNVNVREIRTSNKRNIAEGIHINLGHRGSRFNSKLTVKRNTNLDSGCSPCIMLAEKYLLPLYFL